MIVKGMEMPQKCGQCKLFHAEHPMRCQAVKAHKDKRIIAPYGAPIPDWCPLIEVPPHGRLIDLDQIIDKYWDGYYMRIGARDLEAISSKTVIEAEE